MGAVFFILFLPFLPVILPLIPFLELINKPEYASILDGIVDWINAIPLVDWLNNLSS
jgi:hypothetical protein